MRWAFGAVAPLIMAIPVLAAAADGNAAAGKAKAEAAGCVACHGTAGIAAGAGVAAYQGVPNLAAEPDLFIQFQLVFFRNGVRKNEIMNATAKSLSDEDIRNLGAYFASLPATEPPPGTDPAPDETELGGRVANAIHCTNCHGDHYEGVDNIARLAGQCEDYLYKALRDFKSGVRTTTGPVGMADVLYPLGDPEMKALAHYLSRLR